MFVPDTNVMVLRQNLFISVLIASHNVYAVMLNKSEKFTKTQQGGKGAQTHSKVGREHKHTTACQ